MIEFKFEKVNFKLIFKQLNYYDLIPIVRFNLLMMGPPSVTININNL